MSPSRASSWKPNSRRYALPFPEYTAVQSHILQDVLARTYQAFFRRVQRGARAGFSRFKGWNRFQSFTFKE